jgi:hypothetical protein
VDKEDLMLFMNEWDIDEALARYVGHPVLGPATQTLANLRDATNANSDGWAYWPKPCRAAKRLQELIQGGRDSRWDTERADVTVAAYRKALVPIKSFRTRVASSVGMDFEIVEVA